MRDEIDAAITRVLVKGDLILREDVDLFEENLAKYVGTKYAVGLNSGTDAIFASLKALGIGRGDEVIVPALTFKATAGAVVSTGATPVLVDLDESWEKYVSMKTKAMIPAHIAGEVSEWWTDDFPVIEDACQALGAVKPMGITQCWSFYPAKILGAYGDAGGLTTNDKDIADEVRDMRNHYKGSNKAFGFNSRLDNIQAAILNVKFKYLPYTLMRRQEIADMYSERLKELPLKLPHQQEGRVWQDYIVVTERRDELYDFLKKEGIETMKNEYPFSEEYPKPIRSMVFEKQSLRLPINEVLTDVEIGSVIQKIHEFFA